MKIKNKYNKYQVHTNYNKISIDYDLKRSTNYSYYNGVAFFD